MLLGLFVLAGLTGCCGGGSEELGSKAFQVLESDLVPADLGAKASLRIVFVPDLHGCAPQQVEAIAALKEFEQGYSDTVIVTAVAFADRQVETLLSHPLPGRKIVTTRQRISAGGTQLPIPRVEAWGPRGELLLLKQISFPIDRKDFFHELQWLRAQTSRRLSSTSPQLAG
jgi:hypothetical protein